MKIFVPVGDLSTEEKRSNVASARKEFIEYYSKRRIFLPKGTAEKIDDINQQSLSSFHEFFYGVHMVEAAKGDGGAKRLEIFEKVHDKMSTALLELEDNFRLLLGHES